jgi:hypothetical protein
VDLEVLVSDGAEDTAAVMEHKVPPTMVFSKQEECSLIDAVRDHGLGSSFVEIWWK